MATWLRDWLTLTGLENKLKGQLTAALLKIQTNLLTDGQHVNDFLMP